MKKGLRSPKMKRLASAGTHNVLIDNRLALSLHATMYALTASRQVTLCTVHTGDGNDLITKQSYGSP